jgi:hypothetical protein
VLCLKILSFGLLLSSFIDFLMLACLFQFNPFVDFWEILGPKFFGLFTNFFNVPTNHFSPSFVEGSTSFS